MSTPYIGEIRMFGGNFAPAGWAFCNGQLMPISENETLFQLIGTTYGGDGQSTFALPDLRGRAPMHAGTGPGLSTRSLGESGGAESVTITQSMYPIHSHSVTAATTAVSQSPAGAVPAGSTAGAHFRVDVPNASMAAAVSVTGGSQPHDNMQPFTAVSFIISLFGVFPPQ